MSPFLSPLSAPVVGGSSPGRSSLLRYPNAFKPIVGEPRDVRFTPWQPPKSRGNSTAQKAGLRYERQTIERLAEEFGANLLPHLGIAFSDNSGARVAIPDCLLRLNGALAILEIKYTHTDFAWWQLRRLYEPLLFRLTRAPIFLIEVCKSYDPSVDFPEEHRLIPEISPRHFTKCPVHVVQMR